MEFINTHSHVYTSKFSDDRIEVIQRAKENGISKILLPDIDSENRPDVLKLAAEYPEMCVPMLGIHPTSINENFERELELLEIALSQNKVCAVGEIGIDLYWDKTFYTQQVTAFIHQMKLAKTYNLPVVIHVRDAFPEIFEALTNIGDSKYSGVFHCFSGTEADAVKAIDFGFKLGIGGVLTYKKSGLDQAIKNIDLQHLVLETDDPWLAPSPHRGKRNEPSFIIHVAQKLAEIKQLSIEDIAKITTENAQKLFAL